MQFAFDRKYILAAAIALAGLSMLVAVFLQTSERLRAISERLDQANEGQRLAQAILITLVDLETSQRGYLLTHEKPYLEPYRSAQERLDRELAELAALTTSDPAEAIDLERLRSAVASKRDEMNETLVIADRDGLDAALVLVSSGRGKASMDEARAALSRIGHRQVHDAAVHRAEQAAHLDRNIAISSILLAAIAALMITIYAFVRREKNLRNRASRLEGDAKTELERLVQVRTGELDSAIHALALSESRMRGILESATDAILTADESQTIVMANAAAAATFRIEAKALMGLRLEQLIPHPFRAKHHADVQAFADGHSPARHMGRSREVMALRADGDVFPIDASISHASVGGQRLYTVILRDITERRQSERELLSSKVKLETALASMTDATFIANVDGQLMDFNEAFVKFHRCSSRDECQKSLADYASLIEVSLPGGEPAPIGDWAVSRALRGETASNVEFGLRRKDTGKCWVGSYSFAPMRSKDGELWGAVVTARDITSIRQAQTDLESAHVELQRLVAMRDTVQDEERRRIARELHDDLQQSLAAIRMDSVAVEGLLPDPSGEIARLVRRIDQLAAAALASTRRIVSDLRPELLEELGLGCALQSLAQVFTERTGIPCTLTAGDDVDELLGSAPQAATCLFRVAQEALNNVAKHAQAQRVEMTLAQDGRTGITLKVQDDGRGMTEQDRRKPLSFGLLGSRERLRALGGSFRIESSPGKGTTVIAELITKTRDDGLQH